MSVLSTVAVPTSELAAAFDRLERMFEQVPIVALWTEWLHEICSRLAPRAPVKPGTR